MFEPTQTPVSNTEPVVSQPPPSSSEGEHQGSPEPAPVGASEPANNEQDNPSPEKKKKETPKVATAKPAQTRTASSKNNSKTKKRRNASDEAVVARARRMSRQQLKKVAQALGLETFDEQVLDQKLSEMVNEREQSMSETERLQAKIKELEGQKAELLGERQNLRSENNRLKKGLEHAEGEKQDLQIEYEMRELAKSSGAKDTDYALHLFRQHVNGDGEHSENPEAFFQSLKTQNRYAHLFHTEDVPAGPSPLATQNKNGQANQTAPTPPTQTQDPVPAPAGSPAEKDDAFDLNRQDFIARTADKYGYRPGML